MRPGRRLLGAEGGVKVGKHRKDLRRNEPMVWCLLVSMGDRMGPVAVIREARMRAVRARRSGL
jgi:hypothetical protein